MTTLPTENLVAGWFSDHGKLGRRYALRQQYEIVGKWVAGPQQGGRILQDNLLGQVATN